MAARSISAMRFASPALQSLSRPYIRSGLLQASTRPLSRAASTAATDARSTATRVKNIALGTSIVVLAGFGYLYVTDTRASVHQWLVVPSLRLVFPDAERAHEVGTILMKLLYALGINIRERGNVDKDGDLSVTVFGEKLNNPLGTSAGIDKMAEIPDPLLALGGSIVEVGGVTPFAQDGNPKPRSFRIPEQKALINRYGLNSKGADDMAKRLRERVRRFAYYAGFGIDEEAERKVLDGEAGVPPGSLTPGKLMLIQVAKNKVTPEDDIEAVTNDYVYATQRLGRYADILVVNVSSPNTPGLRTLQNVEPLTKLLTGVMAEAHKTNRKTKPKVMVKVSPDEDDDSQIQGIVEAIWRSGVDGVIVGNTTKRRDGLVPEGQQLSPKGQQVLQETGGYSGPQMFPRTLDLVKRYRALLDKGPPSDLSDSTPKPISGVPSGDEPASTVAEKIESAQQSVKNTLTGSSSPYFEPKVIFATGGISTGKQALEILNAGASVTQVYTAL